MSLADQEILELHELCGALADDRLSAEQGRRLSELLGQSDEARRIYFQSIALSRSLEEYAGEMQADAPLPMPVSKGWQRQPMVAAVIGLAASIVMALVIQALLRPVGSSTDTPAHDELADADLQTGTLVARLTGAKDCLWKGANQPKPGDALHHGQTLELEQGTAEITFDSGAQIVLDAPAALDVKTAWEAVLRRGGLKATVQPQAAGFRVHHSSVEVLDLGTEFSMVADADGDAEVKVLKGSVEVSPSDNEEITPAVMRENESRQFGKGHKNRHKDFAKRQAKLALATSLDRWQQPVHYCHWSFDEAEDTDFKAEAFGMQGLPKILAVNAATPTLTEGRWQKALHLDGKISFSGPVPGISRAAPRTMAFWVKVPEDAQLSEAEAMIAWQMSGKKAGKHVLEIGWNRDPNKGTLGALRTQLGKIYAVGATPLRDGRWHHIAIVFVPVGSENGPVQVTQYVDGRLEGTTLRGIKNKRGSEDDGDDLMWIGHTPRLRSKTHFRGDMDELFVMDRALSPTEIIRLMTQNLPPRSDIAAALPDSNSSLVATTP